ncbi:MAG: hypothetical protein ACK4N6_03815 [Rhodocyclaceae bacterium]
MRQLAAALLFLAAGAQAHEVDQHIGTREAVVITLTYANGQPFAYEKYALTPAGQETPLQVGNTDAAGRIAFVPDGIEKWRLQTTSADGHGVNQEIVVPATGTAVAATNAANELPRWLLAGCGLSLIFGLFGLWQLFVRKKA